MGANDPVGGGPARDGRMGAHLQESVGTTTNRFCDACIKFPPPPRRPTLAHQKQRTVLYLPSDIVPKLESQCSKYFIRNSTQDIITPFFEHHLSHHDLMRFHFLARRQALSQSPNANKASANTTKHGISHR